MDSRESADPHPWLEHFSEDVRIERGALETGDFALAALPDAAVIERKAVGDLLACLGRDSLVAKDNANRVALQAARREHEIKLDTLETEKLIADFRGTAAARELFALSQQEQLLRRRLNLAKPEDRPGIEAELSQNQGQTRAAIHTQVDRQDQSYLARVESTIGRGPAEALRFLGEQMKVLSARIDGNTKGVDEHGNRVVKDEGLDSKQMQEAHKIVMAREEIVFQGQQQSAGAAATNRQINRRGYQPTLDDKNSAAQDSYGSQIAQAEHGGDPARAGQLRTNRDAEEFQNAVDESQMTADQRAERQRHNNERRRAEAMTRARTTPRGNAWDAPAGNDADKGNGAAPEAGHGPHSAAEAPENTQFPSFDQAFGSDAAKKLIGGIPDATPDWSQPAPDAPDMPAPPIPGHDLDKRSGNQDTQAEYGGPTAAQIGQEVANHMKDYVLT